MHAPLGSNFLIFMQSLGKIWPNHMLVAPPSAPYKKSTHFSLVNSGIMVVYEKSFSRASERIF